MTSSLETPRGVDVLGPSVSQQGEVLTREALAFVAELHRTFDARRRKLLAARAVRQQAHDAGKLPGFLPETANIRDDHDWHVAAIPERLLDRRVEITGPAERKMMINALNSGARVFMADFEDSLSPNWQNVVAGQVNLLHHANGVLHYSDARTGKTYEVEDDPAALIVRTRGLHLDEAHVRVEGESVAGAFFDLGIHLYHNAEALAQDGLGPWYYIPKIEHHEEAQLWAAVFRHAEDRLGLEQGTIKVTCLIETLPAAFQMDEILHALKDHAVGLNAGRWDYIFSCVKVTRNNPELVMPNRAQVTMMVPFMRAYTELLVQTCHRRGAFAMGGMSAFIPNRRDRDVTARALAAVRADKQREAADGFDGTWVAHPDLVRVAMEVFDDALGDQPNQLLRLRDDVDIDERDLLDLEVPGGRVTHEGVAGNVEVAIQYLEAWLAGTGAVAIHNLMEDAATAEICRSQLWQWVHHSVTLEDGTPVTRELVERLINETISALRVNRNVERLTAAARILRSTALQEDCPDFFTPIAYDVLTAETSK